MPLAPHENVIKLINHIGAIVRENIPISYRYWKGSEAARQHENEDESENVDETENEDEHQDDPSVMQHVVPDTEKNMIWEEVEAPFSFPKDTRLKDVRTWAMQKGAVAFQSYKKRLNKDYIRKGHTPDFTKKGNTKLRDHWDAFVQYKQSEDAAKLIATNTANARKRKEFHHLGPRGYKMAMPKWDRMEQELMARGIVPATQDWPE